MLTCGHQRDQWNGLVKFADHGHWRDILNLLPTGRFYRSTTGCEGNWRAVPNDLISLQWDEWEPEILTPGGNILPMGEDGKPVVDLSGRLGNQCIWLGYALRIGAGSIRPNLVDGYALEGIPHGLKVLAPIPPRRIYGSRWEDAADWSHLSKVRSDLQRLLLPRDLPKIEAISMHVRLGDKMGHSGYLPFSREFAVKALEILPDDLEVHVFSDSPGMARTIVDGLHPKIRFMPEASAREDFLTMCSHTHHVIPDSTFSWMAAFLSPHRMLAVHAPNPSDRGIHEFPEFHSLVNRGVAMMSPAPHIRTRHLSQRPFILVSSPGGMGCTSVLTSLTENFATNAENDSDGLKHCPNPDDPGLGGLDFRIVYIWNDPLKSVLSLFRRGWAEQQCAKLRGEVKAARNLDTLWDATLTAGTDVFGIWEHARKWLQAPRRPTFFLDMRDLDRLRPDLERFLGISVSGIRFLSERSRYEMQALPRSIRSIYRNIDRLVRRMGNAVNSKQWNPPAPPVLPATNDESDAGRLIGMSSALPRIEIGKNSKIIVGICSARQFAGRRRVIRETWLSQPAANMECRFLVGRGESLPDEPDVVVLDADDHYEALPSKLRSFFAWACENSDFEWLFKCDDDTYVALDRLASLPEAGFDLIADESQLIRGAPSGGAGYFLSRRIVEAILADPTLPLEGAEDLIFGHSAMRNGAQVKITPRLHGRLDRFPHFSNDLVTTHRGSPERFRIIRSLLAANFDTVELSHPVWGSDEAYLASDGSFMRRDAHDEGRWSIDGYGNLNLAWTGWPAESFAFRPNPSLATERLKTWHRKPCCFKPTTDR